MDDHQPHSAVNQINAPNNTRTAPLADALRDAATVREEATAVSGHREVQPNSASVRRIILQRMARQGRARLWIVGRAAIFAGANRSRRWRRMTVRRRRGRAARWIGLRLCGRDCEQGQQQNRASCSASRFLPEQRVVSVNTQMGRTCGIAPFTYSCAWHASQTLPTCCTLIRWRHPDYESDPERP